MVYSNYYSADRCFLCSSLLSDRVPLITCTTTTTTTTTSLLPFNADAYRLDYNKTQSESKKAKIKEEWDAHRKQADQGYKWRKEDRARALDGANKTQMLVRSSS